MTAPRRSLLVALALGLVGLLAGLYALVGVFGEELREAEHSLSVERSAAVALGRRAVLDALGAERAGAEARLAAWGEDPLTDAHGLLAVVDGRAVLPPSPPREGAAELPDVDAALRGEGGADDPVWGERVQRARAVTGAGDDEALAGALRDFLDHAARFQLAPVRQLAAQLVVAEALAGRASVRRDLIEQLLVEGIGERPFRVEGAAPALVRARDEGRLVAEDVDTLRARTTRLLEAGRLPSAPLLTALAVPPASQEAPTAPRGLFVRGEERWLGWEEGGDRFAVLIDEPGLLEGAAAPLRQEGLLPPDTRLTLAGPRPVALEDLRVEPVSTRWEDGLARARRRYRQKVALAGLTGLLGAAVLGLAALFVQRQQRFVELKNDFVAAVSHELRTPVAAIRLLAETLERRVGRDPQAKDYPTRIVREADRLGFLVENILSWGRIERGRWRLREEAVDLSELLSEVRAQVVSHLPGAEVDVELAPGTRVDADPELMQLLFTNLVKNGLTYNERSPPRVRVFLEDADTGAVGVEDNGVGVPEADRQRIFEPFERTTGADRVASKGSGLGLSLCRRILRLHGGELRLAASGPEGSRFVAVLGRPVRLPEEGGPR